MEKDEEISGISSESSILYELLVYSEWKQEPELPKILPPRHEGLISLLRSILCFPTENNVLSCSIERLLSCHQPWRLAVGDGGKVVAIIQEGSLEIRSSRDEYSSIIGKAGLPKDLFPQWRRWCWSPDCSILALGFSNGSIRAYDLMGSNLFTILPVKCQQEQASFDTCHALSACFFVQARTSTRKWSSELVTVDYRGNLRSFLVSPTEGFQESHSFSFSRYYKLGVSSVAYHPAHSILFLAGPTGSRKDPNIQEHGSGIGVTAWRVLNDYPFYKLVSNDKKHDGGFLPESFWNRLPSLRHRPQQSIVIRMEVSPSAKFLAALHSCGGVSIWSVPSLRKLGFWPLIEQPGWNMQNPLNIETPTLPQGKKTQTSVSIDSFYPVDIDWWSDEALVLSRNCGAVSVCEITTLTNLLGESPEFLAGAAQVRKFHNEKGFLALECETETLSKNRNSEVGYEEDLVAEDSEDESEDDEKPSTFLNQVSAVISSAAYLVTDLERFRPKRKRLRLYRRTYRLLALRSTTPEELYSRKLDNEEYGEALTLAHTYNLDCDLVYQRQWRNSKVSVATIRDFLSKVSKQMWVLNECIERVPESLLAARELLEFGLKATCKDTFKSLCSKRKVKDASDLTDEQRQFLVFRRTLLHYQDRLTTYEKILGGSQLADELFEYTTYSEFRSASSLRACVQFARTANCQAVECMLTYHGSQTQQHWLPILSNIPETICPTEYRLLLPECSSESVVFPLKESRLRDLDWSEKEPFNSIDSTKLDTPEEENECLYQYEPSLSAYRGPVQVLTPALIQQWYCERIRAIERSSRMVDNALTLLRLAQDRNVEGLGSLHQELLTLDALVYELYLEDISLEDLEKKSSLEKCKLLMSKTSEDSFVSDLKNLLFPFLDRIENITPGKRQELFHQYLVGLASEDLVLPQKFFEQLYSGEDFGTVTHEEQISLVQDCLYAYLGTDQLHVAQQILAYIPRNRETLVFHEIMDTLEKELAACLVLQRNHTPKTLGYIRDNKHDVHTVTQLLTRMARTVARSTQPPSETVWSILLKDTLDLQQSVFTCAPIETCYEIFCSTLLSSGDPSSIKLASRHFNSNLKVNEQNQMLSSTFRLPVDKSQSLLLAAAREYIDSAGSLTDPSMDLALACLHLAPNEHEEVQEELNLVSAFQLLHEFGISMLPLQVRLCPDRLRLISDCLKKKPGAHRSVNRLLQLAAFLNICGDDFRERRGRVRVLVAETAFSVNDLRCCGEICKDLAVSGYAAGWQVVSQLGRCSHFNDLTLRAQLLAFALQHCPAALLQELIEARCSLEIDSLQVLVKKQIAMHNTSLSAQLDDPTPMSGSDSVGGDFLQSLQVGEMAVRETTHKLLSRVGDTQFWKKAFHIGWDDEKGGDGSETAVSQDRFVCHAFYLSLFDSTPCTPSSLGPRYDSYAPPDVPPRIQLEQALLQISLLEQGCESEERNIANILTECACSLLPEDNCLGLAHLLAVPESVSKDASGRVFGSNPTTISLKLAQYHAALLQYRILVTGNAEKLHNVLLHDPNEVIDFVLREACPQDTWASTLRDWRSRLADFKQDQDLLHLDCGIDIERFSSDEQYRQDSILGLAMSDEIEKLYIALSLAARHNIQRSKVIAEHLVGLLLSNSPATEIMERVNGSELNELISEAPLEIQTKIESSVLPILNGKQIDHLEICYGILNKVAPDSRSGRLLPKDHLKLLSKVRGTSAVIDYKLLLSGPKYTLQAVESSLTVENIPLVSKLLKAMPSTLASYFTSSQLYGTLIRRQLQTCHDIQACVSAVCPLLENMKPADVLELMKHICFPENEESKCLPYKAAEDLLEAAVFHCKKAIDTDCSNQLEKWRHHVNVTKCLSQKWPDNSSCRAFFNTRGELGDISNLVLTVFLSEEKSLDFVLDLINATNSLSFEGIVTDLLKKIHSSFTGEEAADWHNLSVLLLRMEQFIFSVGNTHLSDKEWESFLHSMATQNELPPDLRLKALNLLQVIRCEETEQSALLLPHTRAIVASAWPQAAVQASDIQEESGRASILLHLLSQTENWHQRTAIQRLLAIWPAFTDSSDSTLRTEIIHQIMLHCLKCEKGEWTDQKATFLTDILKEHSIGFNSVDKILQEFQQDGSNHSDDEDESVDEQVDVQLLMLVCLLCEDTKAHFKAVTLAQHRLMEPLHDEVAELIVSRQLVVDLISTPAYSDLLSFALNLHPEQAESIIKSLIHRKYIPEAGAVVLRTVKSVPRFMRTFSASLMAGLGKPFERPLSSTEVLVSENEPNQLPVCADSESETLQSNEQQTSAVSMKINNDWDVSDEEWSNVDETAFKSQPDEVMNSNVDQARVPLKEPKAPASPPEPKKNLHLEETPDKASSELNVPKVPKDEGWGDWSDDELERMPSERPADEASGQAFLPTDAPVPTSSTPSSFLPSSRSAFVRVPQRDQRQPELSETEPQLDKKPVDEGWEDNSDEDWNW